jgi:hypothetical protein
MADKKPGMITGANAKIKVGETTLAYASDVSYNLTIDHIPVEVMNKYEVVSNEPVAMTLSGSFSVVRYSKAAAESVPVIGADGNPTGEKTTVYVPGSTNSPNVWKQDSVNKLKPFSPGDLLASKTFDITISQRYSGADGREKDVVFLKFKDCRITGRSTSLNKRSVMSERFDFVGETMDDDKIQSAASGDTDLS